MSETQEVLAGILIAVLVLRLVVSLRVISVERKVSRALYDDNEKLRKQIAGLQWRAARAVELLTQADSDGENREGTKV